jgi:hypothetical protein
LGYAPVQVGYCSALAPEASLHVCGSVGKDEIY